MMNTKIFSILLVAASLLIITSCSKKNFGAGDCVQSPDSGTIWKISEIDVDKLYGTVQNKGPEFRNTPQEMNPNANWTKTDCPKI